MGFISKSKQQTKLSNGDKPSYEQLEESFINLWDKVNVLENDRSRLNQELADARYTIKKMKEK